jgi:uncharacterized protein (TIGR00251 family)
MKIKIKVHANSSQEKINKTKEGLEVWIKSKPVEGKANSELLKLLKNYFKKDIKIISGLRSNKKIIEVK